MRRLMAWLLGAILLALGGPAWGQDTSSAPPQAPPPAKDKKEKKKKDKKAQQDVLNADVFSDDVARAVLDDVRDGLEGHMQRLFLSAFDADEMDGYLSFEDQIEAFFNKYEGLRVHFEILQTAVEGPKGIVLVSIEMEELPHGGSGAPIRKNTQMRFELQRGKKGWRIVDIRPRGFFS